MKRKRLLSLLVSVLLLCAIAFNISSCVLSVSAENLLDGIERGSVQPLDDMTEGNVAITDFALRMLRGSVGEENVLLSPLSIVLCLALAQNGTAGNTRAEMEEMIGIDTDTLNRYLYTYVSSLPESEKYKLSVANSIWIRDVAGFNVRDSFLQVNADHFDSAVYRAAFDRQTINDINNWVNLNTDGMIPKLLDNISDEEIMYLINALAFEAEWASKYEKYDVTDSIFTTESGVEQTVEMMHSTEGRYLSDDNAKGFIKYYKDYKYAFAALLPDEGVSIAEYISSLSGEDINAMLNNAESATVEVAIPKFKTEYSSELSKLLAELGMTDAFNPELADFSELGSIEGGHLYVGKVIHKTYIELGEQGTRAGAVTSMGLCGSAGLPDEIKTVTLDRPFVYMLIDCENDLPFFIGAQMEIK